MYSYMAILKKIGVGCALFSNITVHYSEYESFQKFKEAQIWTTDWLADQWSSYINSL